VVSGKNEEYGVNYKYDPDRLFVRYNNGKDYGIAQFYVFGKYCKLIITFYLVNNVKK